MRSSDRPKLGQHFLADTPYRRRIADSLGLRPEDLVVEIGPGKGAMTGLLAERAGRVIAIELDARLARELGRRLADNPKIEILAGDILEINLAAVCPSPDCFVFGNIPYYATSPILHHILSFYAMLRSMALVVQREVADRLQAAPGSRDYGYLSVFIQSYARPRIALTIPPGAFRPVPKVHSALVRFEMRPPAEAPQAEFFEFVKRCFACKRKQLATNLSASYGRGQIQDSLSALGLAANLRAEEMSLEQLRALFDRLRPAFNHA